jgi:hypothetical protein
MTAADHLSGDQFMDLYHHTTPEAAEAIKSTGKMQTLDNTGRAYFTTHADSEYAHAFGPAQVHVRIPKSWAGEHDLSSNNAILDDEFPSGEQHYAVKINRLKKEHFV